MNILDFQFLPSSMIVKKNWIRPVQLETHHKVYMTLPSSPAPCLVEILRTGAIYRVKILDGAEKDGERNVTLAKLFMDFKILWRNSEPEPGKLFLVDHSST